MNIETKERLQSILLEDSFNELEESITKPIEDFKTSLEARIDGLKVEANRDLKEIENYITVAKPLVVNLGTVEAPKNKLAHSVFPKLMKILSSTKRKEKNIMLVGGAGGGKTHLASSVAEALKLQFYPMSVGLQTTKSDLLGFINAHGVYMPSPIRLAYENGGVLLLDEFDAAHAGVITILNSLLANGHCSFPDKIVEKHKAFVCLCACNTYGKGGTMEYVGRNRLDAATLDRFIVLDVGYDNSLETLLTNNDKWLKTVNTVREIVKSQGIKMIVSPRAAMDGADLLEAGFTEDEALEMCIFKGCSEDIKDKILRGLELLNSGNSLVYVNILVDFNKKTYSTEFYIDSEVDIKLGDFTVRAAITENHYIAYLTHYTLYVNNGRGKLDDTGSSPLPLPFGAPAQRYNQIQDIQRFIKCMQEAPKSLAGEYSMLLTVIHRNKKHILDTKAGTYKEVIKNA
jgi:cobaltochelatase CobS